MVLDNLSQGRREAVGDAPLIVADLHEQGALEVLFQAYPIQAVMHFASFSHPTLPINPYGQSKLMVEQMLSDFERAYQLRSICLRYFNAAGADPDNQLGECHTPETHLIPLVLQAASGRRAAITIYGEDYPTPDGTCLRDYIHVQDLCDAHLLALQALAEGRPSARYNLGNGNGYSIREVIAAAERVTGRRVPIASGPRRDGDPARLVADAARARRELGWQPQFSELDAIIAHAWAWEQRLHPAPPPLRAVPSQENQERRQQDRRTAHRAA